MLIDHGQKFGLYCHDGYDQAATKMSLESGTSIMEYDKPTIMSCKDGEFYDPKNVKVSITTAKCSAAMVPVVTKVADLCSDLGADARDDNLEGNLFKVVIGWNITGIKFVPQASDNKITGRLMSSFEKILSAVELSFQGRK